MSDLVSLGESDASGAYVRCLLHMAALSHYYTPSGLLDIPHHLVPREVHYACLLHDLGNIE